MRLCSFLVAVFFAVSATEASVQTVTYARLEILKKEVSHQGGSLVVGYCNQVLVTCRAFERVLDDVESTLSDHGKQSGVKVVYVDATTQSKVTLHGITHFPTLEVHSGQRHFPYLGDYKNKQEMLDFIHAHVETARMPVLKTKSEVEAFLNKVQRKMLGAMTRVILYIPDTTVVQFTGFHEIMMNVTDNSILLFAPAVVTDPGLLLFPDMTPVQPLGFVMKVPNQPKAAYGTYTTDEEFKQFIADHIFQDGEMMSMDTVFRLSFSNRPICAIFVDDAQSHQVETMQRAIKELSDLYRGKIRFMLGTKTALLEHEKQFAMPIRAEDIPTAIYFENLHDHRHKIFPTNTPLSVGSLRIFLDGGMNDYHPDHGRSTTHSEEAPLQPYDTTDGFIKAVATTLPDHIFNNKNATYIVLMYYTDDSSCKLCPQIRRELAQLRKRVPSDYAHLFSFVKFDPTKNAFDWRFTPSFIFPQFVFYNRTDGHDYLQHWDTVASPISTLEYIMEELFGHEFGHHTMEVGHIAPDPHNPHAYQHHTHLSHHDCHSKTEAEYLFQGIRKLRRELNTLYRMLHGEPEPEGYFGVQKKRLN